MIASIASSRSRNYYMTAIIGCDITLSEVINSFEKSLYTEKARKTTSSKISKLLVTFLMLAVVSSSVVLIVSAQQEEIKREDSLVIAYDQPFTDVQNWNPFLVATASDKYKSGAIPAMYEFLFYLNYNNGTVHWWLATGYEYDANFTTLKFFIRHGVHWSDGEPFTARDVVYTLKVLMADPAIGFQDIVAHIKNVYAPDDYTAVIEYDRSSPRAYWDFCSIYKGGLMFVPEHVWSAAGVDIGQGGTIQPHQYTYYPNPISTGPFVLYSSQAERTIFQRDENYWGKDVFGVSPQMKWLISVYVATGDQDMMGLEKNDIDVAFPILVHSQYEEIKKVNPTVHWIQELDMLPRVFYVNLYEYPFNDSSVRWALAHAINQSKMTDVVWEGYAYSGVAYGSIYKVNEKYIPYDKIAQYNVSDYDPNELPQLLESKGFTRGNDGIFLYPNGTRMSFNLVGDPWMRAQTELLSADLRNVGIEGVVKLPSWEESQSMLYVGGFDLLLTYVQGFVNPVDPLKLFSSLLSYNTMPVGQVATVGQNLGRWNNTQFDQIYAEADKLSAEDPAFVEKCKELNEIFLKDLAIIPLNYCTFCVVSNGHYWQGWPTSDPTPDSLYSGIPFMHIGLQHQVLFSLEKVQQTNVETGIPMEWVAVAVVIIAVVIIAVRARKRKK